MLWHVPVIEELQMAWEVSLWSEVSSISTASTYLIRSLSILALVITISCIGSINDTENSLIHAINSLHHSPSYYMQNWQDEADRCRSRGNICLPRFLLEWSNYRWRSMEELPMSTNQYHPTTSLLSAWHHFPDAINENEGWRQTIAVSQVYASWCDARDGYNIMVAGV